MMDRLGAKPVPEEQIKAFKDAMEVAIQKGEAYRREQAKLLPEVRQRIVF